MNSSFELLEALKKLGHIKEQREDYWWPNSGSFEVIVGAVLTQQARWQKVEVSLENLKKHDALNLDTLAHIKPAELSIMIKPSGFYNTKAKNLNRLCKNIQEEFENFQTFCENVERSWLLAQKGVGEETADSILCYACLREVFVVDSYTNRLLKAFGFEFESYGELQEWMRQGIEENYEKIEKLYGQKKSLHEVYSRFHGKIVEFCKENMRGKKVDISVLGLDD